MSDEIVAFWSGNYPSDIYDEFTVRECFSEEPPLLFDAYLDGKWAGSRATRKSAEDWLTWLRTPLPPPPQKKAPVEDVLYAALCDCGVLVSVDYRHVEVLKWCSACCSMFRPTSVNRYSAK